MKLRQLFVSKLNFQLLNYPEYGLTFFIRQDKTNILIICTKIITGPLTDIHHTLGVVIALTWVDIVSNKPPSTLLF